MRISFTTTVAVVALQALFGLAARAQQMQPVSLPQALALAAEHDPWIDRSSQIEAALEARGIAAGALPDPVLSIGVANLPTDSFRFSQEPMTQAQIGITQRIPRGDSLDLARQKFTDLRAREPLERAHRRAMVQRDVTRAWLDAWRAQRSIDLVESNRELFAYLVDLTRSRYTSALGPTRQQDVVRAELELTRLEDRIYRLHAARDASLATLAGWLFDPRSAAAPAVVAGVEADAPPLALQAGDAIALDTAALDAFLSARLQSHPAVRSLDQRIAASRTERAIAEQAYRPGWAINASYGYRDDAPTGEARADFFSLGVAFDLPLFTASRQDPQVRAATADTESLITERALLLRELRSQVQRQVAQLRRLQQRAELYREQLLRQMREQAEVYLVAYRNDDADFNDVVSARIDALNARIEALELDAGLYGTIAELNYLLAQAPQPEEGES
jgi:outer membrane protein TolC